MFAADAPTESVTAPVPDACDSVSHGFVPVAVHAGLPVVLIATVVALGFDPAVQFNVTAVGAAEIVIGAAATVSVAAIVLGDPVAPVALTVTTPVYVPA